MARRVKVAGIALIATLAAGCLYSMAAAQAPQAAQRQPVLIELFTSEGCSDCPPADALLGTLDAQQFVPGAQAIVLSEHVTYWNREGWRDPFSFEQMTDRQQDYARQFALNDVYTPQIVVDGAEQFVGNVPDKLTRAVARAAAVPKVDLAIEGAREASDGTVTFSVRAASAVKSTLLAAVAENATSSEVARGENAGRTLHHVAVVRVLKDFGAAATDGRPLQLSGANLSAAEKTGIPLRLVVFLVNHKNGHVIGVAEQTVTQSAPTGTVEQTAR